MITGQMTIVPSVLDRYHAQSQSDLEVYAWIRVNLPTDARIMADRDAPLYLHTGRQSSRPPNMPQPYRQDAETVRKTMAALPEFARGWGLGYWMLGATDFDDNLLVEEAVDLKELTSSEPYHLVFESGQARLYRIE